METQSWVSIFLLLLACVVDVISIRCYQYKHFILSYLSCLIFGVLNVRCGKQLNTYAIDSGLYYGWNCLLCYVVFVL
jgi:hypothetical protein